MEQHEWDAAVSCTGARGVGATKVAGTEEIGVKALQEWALCQTETSPAGATDFCEAGFDLVGLEMTSSAGVEVIAEIEAFPACSVLAFLALHSAV